jgi:hypothetical protein
VVAVYVFGGTAVMLAVRSSALKGKQVESAWREALALFSSYPGKSLLIWLQAALADIFFLLLAWPLSAVLPWAVNQFARNIGFTPLRSLVYFIEYAVLALGFLIGQVAIQCYKSSLWTITYGEFRKGVIIQDKEAVIAERKAAFEPPLDFMPSSGDGTSLPAS